MDNTQKFNCISLCTGYAGIELGLERVIPNFRTVCYVEVEAFACTNLVAKIEEGKLAKAPIWTDIKTFDGRPFYKRVHIITAGYPCQPFSVAGKQKGTDDPRHLWPHIERIIETVRPVWFFGENVSGHLAIGYPEVYRSLRNLGYTVEAGLFTAAECGAPHRRERLFILGHSKSNGHSPFPQLRSDETASNDRRQEKQAKTRQSSRTNRPLDVPSIQGSAKRGELADTTGKRIQRPEPARTAQAGRQAHKQGVKWPARPGQPQHEWEEPRVVANSKRQRPIQSESTPRHRQELSTNGSITRQKNNTTKGQAQSRLGGAVDGVTYPLDIAKGIRGGYYVKPGGEIGHDLVIEAKMRVNRLRLLGNGAVPQCAVKAFITLLPLFEKG